jgi:hypothetical protein
MKQNEMKCGQQCIGVDMHHWDPWLHHIPSLGDGTMGTKICTSEVEVILAPLSLAQQWVRIGKHCWVRQGIASLKYEVG